MFKAVTFLSGRCAQISWSQSLAKFHLESGPVCQKAAINPRPDNLLEMPPCNVKPEEYKGMSKQRMMEVPRQSYNPVTMKITYFKRPVFIHQGHMQWLWDVDGKRYLDLFAGVATVAVGHCNPKVVAATERQLRKLGHTTNIYVHPTLQEYTEKLTSLLPDPLKASRVPLPPEAMGEIFEDIKDMGVLFGKGGIYGQVDVERRNVRTFRIQPPMCITREDVDFFLAVFTKALHRHMEKK